MSLVDKIKRYKTAAKSTTAAKGRKSSSQKKKKTIKSAVSAGGSKSRTAKASARSSAKQPVKSKAAKAKKSVKAAPRSATRPPARTPVRPPAKAPPKVKDAVEKRAAAKNKVDQASQEEAELQKELAEEIEKDSRKRSSLVKEDYSPANATRDTLIVEYAPLIKYIAQKIAARLPANIELDDLISSGVIGLMDAIDKYDSSRDNKFKTYAEFRIRGAILDELRAQDWVPRSVREKAKQLERCYARIEQQKGRQATEEEVCKELGLNTEEFHDMLNQVRSVSLLSFDDVSNFSKADKKSLHGIGESGPKAATPFNEVSVAYLKKMISKAIEDLPEKQRLVLSLYYYEDLNLKEIGRVLDVTESRVSQLHTQAILRLKGRLRNHWDEFVTIMG